MGTSTQYLFGEVTRAWSIGAYNKGEAGRARRIQKALAEYSSWIFNKRIRKKSNITKKRKRGDRGAGPTNGRC